MLIIDSQEPKSDSQSLISTPRRPKLIRRQIYSMTFRSEIRYYILSLWIKGKKAKLKGKKAN